ncbi:MAG TPA: SDR family NAD(P)-dependent oxidoreductase [Candidatus Binatus sp.]|nr:SDR family NAD(P)-dependent oxidoreductase [Candidatus Binatus sp.]
MAHLGAEPLAGVARLAGRVAIVTGAGQGIGRGIALVLARHGARLCIAELKEHRGERTAQEIRAAGGDAFAVAADVGRKTDVERMVDETLRRWGSTDILVNNAHGFGDRAKLEEIPDEQFDLSWTSGVKGTWWAMCATRPHMAARGWGRIVNMVSLAADRGDAGLGEYNAAKAGIMALTRTAAREWGRQGITVNAIAPGAWTKRGQDYAARDPEGFAKAMAARPIGRLGDPETDIAPVALFLATDDAQFVTGHVFYVDGGAHLG